jgi:NitT/TauT family transport system substrate-binding protein
MKFKQWLSLPLAAALLAAATAMAAEKFRVGYLRVMDDAQAIVAQEGGYYQKAGLDSELIEFKSGTDLIKAIVGGQLDIGVLGFTNAVAWASKGADLKVVGGAQQGYHSLVVRDDSGIQDIAGLKGKTLASQAEGSTADVVLKGVVLKQGVSPAVAVQSLVGKRVDAAFLFEPYDRIAQLVAPVKQIYEVGQAWPFPCMVVITSGETLAKRKDDVWKALDAQNQAITLLQKEPAQASKLIASYFIAEPTISTQVFTPKLTEKDTARMQEIADILQAQGSLKTRDGKPYDVSSIVDLSWQEARKL